MYLEVGGGWVSLKDVLPRGGGGGMTYLMEELAGRNGLWNFPEWTGARKKPYF